MSTIEEFKESHRRFSEALEYITKNEESLKAIPGKWDKVVANFRVKFEAKLDEAWKSLTADQQKSLSPLYLHRRAQEDPAVNSLLKTFDAKIISVEE